jgi:predicted ArsR family transcriptional regulator
MDLFGERILSVLSDGKPRVFLQLLGKVGFSRNTLKLQLKRLTSQSLAVKEKMLSNGRGRPKYAYFLSPRAMQQVFAALPDPSITIVTLPFSRLRHLCRFEKGGYCKQARNKWDPGSCPQIPKKTNNRNHF